MRKTIKQKVVAISYRHFCFVILKILSRCTYAEFRESSWKFISLLQYKGTKIYLNNEHKSRHLLYIIQFRASRKYCKILMIYRVTLTRSKLYCNKGKHRYQKSGILRISIDKRNHILRTSVLGSIIIFMVVLTQKVYSKSMFIRHFIPMLSF